MAGRDLTMVARRARRVDAPRNPDARYAATVAAQHVARMVGPGVMPAEEHGTCHGYAWHRCRCESCRAAWNTAASEWKAAKRKRDRADTAALRRRLRALRREARALESALARRAG